MPKRKGGIRMRKTSTFTRFITLLIVLAMTAVACSGGSGNDGSSDTTAPPTNSDGSPSQTQERCAPDRTEYSPPHNNPGPAVDKIQFSQHGVDQAVADLRNDNIDFYQFSLKLSAAEQLRQAEDMKAYCAPSGSVSLVLNPAPATGNRLNPFSIIEVRQAMNYLVDREFIANSIYGGFAIPQVTQVSKVDYDYLTVADVVAQSGIRHDADLARRMVTDAMENAGAELVDGKWHYNNQPIRVKFIIRVEDERREIGDAVRASLESLGFEVVPIYKNFAAALSTVYSSDPQAFEWHLYTEGWGSSSAQKYDFGKLNQFTAPWMAQMPGWQIFGFWQYENEKLDELGQEIFKGEFESREQRDELYREATNLALDEAVRIWVVTTFNTFPAKKDLSGVTEDVVSGPRSALTLREAHIPGEEVLRVGSLWVWTERSVWNHVDGFGDVYSLDIWKNLRDPALINDPFRGVPIPFRADFEVETAGPSAKLEVAGDAVMWNAQTDQWDVVPAGTQATSRVVFDFSKYFNSVWHHGQSISMADVLYTLASQFDRTYDPDKRQIEFVLAATQKPLLDVFRGFRILDDNRIEVYLDYWHFDESYIASYANLADSAFPWEVQAASDEVVFERRMAAYSSAASARYNIPWLSLAQDKSGATLVNKALRDFVRMDFVPEGVFTVNGTKYVTTEDAQARYGAALDWFSQRDHLIISNGPFTLERFDPAAQYAEIHAFRDDNYPFKPGDWFMERPDGIEFGDVNTESDGTVTVAISGTDNAELRYLVVDPRSSEVKASGFATNTGNGEFTFNLDSDTLSGFESGRLEIRLLASSEKLVTVKEKVIFK